MILRVFAVYDSAVQAYLPPFFERSNGAALRAFAAAVDDPKHSFSRSSGDFALCLIGEFDDATGYLSKLGPDVLCRAQDIVLGAKEAAKASGAVPLPDVPARG